MEHLGRLNEVLEEIVQRWDIPGLAVGMVQGEEIVYTRTFGVQSLETRAPVTLGSIFGTASVSKAFVATALMQLVERGQVELDAPIVQYLPYFKLDDERYPQITVRQVLSHTSGMPDMDETEYDHLVAHPEWDDGAAERYVRGLHKRKMYAAPGETFWYSNIGFNVLGDLIAKVTGKTFEQAIREQLLLPAGMPDSTFLMADVPLERLAVPHLRSPQMKVSPFYPYHRADAPASFLHATVPDMCHFASACLRREGLLSRATFDLMWTPVAKRSNVWPSMYEEIGLGWTLGHFKGRRTVSHGGMGFGWADFFFLLPEQNCGGVMLCVEESYARTRIVHAMADTLLGMEPVANKVSWSIPISRALAAGGVPAMYTRYEEIKGLEEEYYFSPDDLINLSYELLSAQRVDLAVAIMDFNIQVHPDFLESYLQRAKYYLLQGEREKARQSCEAGLAVVPDDQGLKEFLQQIG